MIKKFKLLGFTISSILIIILLFIILGFVQKTYLKAAYPLKYKSIVTKASNDYNVNVFLIYAIIKEESNFNPQVVSKADAIGLMQITPQTFKWLKSRMGENELDERYLMDPDVNIKYGTYFLSILLKKYSDESVAICAYNAGMGAIDRWLNDPNLSYDMITLESVPYKETDAYSKQVINSKKIYENLYFKE